MGERTRSPRRYVHFIVNLCTRSVQQFFAICAIICSDGSPPAQRPRRRGRHGQLLGRGPAAPHRAVERVDPRRPPRARARRRPRRPGHRRAHRGGRGGRRPGPPDPGRARRAGRRRGLAARRGGRQRPPRRHRHHRPMAGAAAASCSMHRAAPEGAPRRRRRHHHVAAAPARRRSARPGRRATCRSTIPTSPPSSSSTRTRCWSRRSTTRWPIASASRLADIAELPASCSSRRAPTSATCSTSRPRAAGIDARCRRPRSTACGCWPRSRSRASAPPLLPASAAPGLGRRRLEAGAGRRPRGPHRSAWPGDAGACCRHRPVPCATSSARSSTREAPAQPGIHADRRARPVDPRRAEREPRRGSDESRPAA